MGLGVALMAGILVPVLGTNTLRAWVETLRVNAARFEADVTRVVEDESARAIRELKRAWPDRGKAGWLRPTGYSKGSWFWEKVGKLQWQLVNTAPYAEYIHPPGNPVRLSDDLVPATVAKMRARIEERLRLLLKSATTPRGAAGGRATGLGRVRL